MEYISMELPEPFGYVREWQGDDSDLNNWLFETDKAELDDEIWGKVYLEEQLRQAIAPYAARLKQAEDVLRMAREDIEVLSRLANTDNTGPRASVAAINQQLGEK